MRILTIALCLLATPALADVAGTASVIAGRYTASVFASGGFREPRANPRIRT